MTWLVHQVRALGARNTSLLAGVCSDAVKICVALEARFCTCSLCGGISRGLMCVSMCVFAWAGWWVGGRKCACVHRPVCWRSGMCMCAQAPDSCVSEPQESYVQLPRCNMTDCIVVEPQYCSAITIRCLVCVGKQTMPLLSWDTHGAAWDIGHGPNLGSAAACVPWGLSR